MKDFKKLMIWQKGMGIVEDTYKLVEALPIDEKFGLRSQLTRAAVSIPSNIAEGSGRGTDKVYKQFLEYSLGSAFELETQLILAERLGMMPPAKVHDLLEKVDEEQKMINSFIRKLSR